MSAAPHAETPSVSTPDTPIASNSEFLVDLVDAARRGESWAWRSLHQRFSPLVAHVCRKHRLSQGDADDVGQVVWLQLVQHLKAIRDARALPGWIATTARNECLRIIRSGRRSEPVDPMVDRRLDHQVAVDPADLLYRLELQRALHEGVRKLPPGQQRLMLLLIADPDISYREVGQRLNMPTGSIGPTRARCLQKLRAMPEMKSLMDDNLAA